MVATMLVLFSKMAFLIYSSSTACHGSPSPLSLSLCLNLCALGNGEGAWPYIVPSG